LLFVLPCVALRAAGEPQNARAEFDQAYAQYKEILRKAADIQDRFPGAAPEDRRKLAEEFNTLVRSGNELRPKLAASAEKVYLSDPKDKTMADMMYALLISSLRADNYAESLRLSKLLIEHGDARPELNAYAGGSAFNVGDYDDAEKYLALADAAKVLDEKGKAMLAGLPDSRRKWEREQKLREAEAKADDLPRVQLTIADGAGHVKGQVVVELFENEAPNTVANFISLVEKHVYDGLTFHRVLPGFMAQGGDPAGDGTGGPGYHIADECKAQNHRDHFRGSLSMAHSSEPNSNGSQFFICFVPTTHLDGQHTVFGRVIEGMDVVDQIQRIDPAHSNAIRPDQILKAVVLRKRPHAYEPQKLP
jgi:cyclophilin family peptidyl-prolyl cis-trans isomerase